MTTIELPSYLTVAGTCREVRCCNATLRRKIEQGVVKPDAILVECAGKPGSLLFKAESLPAIAKILNPE